MTERQLEIADIFISSLLKRGGYFGIDDLSDVFDRSVYIDIEVSIVWDLLKQLELVYEKHGGRTFVLTINGFKAAEHGIRLYLEKMREIENTKESLPSIQLKNERGLNFRTYLALCISILSILLSLWLKL